jgi:hypothetical protein
VKETIVLWEERGITCRSRVFSSDRIEITLARNEEVIERKMFTDIDSAAKYAVEKMYARGAS